MKHNVAVVYFDDIQIVGQIAEVDGQTVVPLATVQKNYSGIIESHFTDRRDFTLSLNSVIAELSAAVGGRVPPVLYIGVANQFCNVETQSSYMEFDRLTKVKRQHLRALWDDIDFDDTGREIIMRKALYYKLEEYENVLLDATGVATMGLSMVASAVTISNEFRPLIDTTALSRAGFYDVRFVCLAECELFMIPEKVRDAGCTLVRCNFFSTSVANVLGDGLMQLSHFNIGNGYLVNDIVENFTIDHEVAMGMLQKSTPTYEMLLDETYTFKGQTLPAGMFNEFALKRIDDFANRLASFDMARVMYLSGGNYDQIYGVKNIISNACDRRVYLCHDQLTGHTNYPEITLNALARYVLKYFQNDTGY